MTVSSNHIVSYHIMSYRIVSYRINLVRSYHIIKYQIEPKSAREEGYHVCTKMGILHRLEDISNVYINHIYIYYHTCAFSA